jgi:hypothetical protein
LSTIDEQNQIDLVSAKHLYSPTVIAVYSVLSSLTIGLLLYSINIYRRGQTWMGVIIGSLALIIMAGRSVAALMGKNVFGINFFMLSIIIAIGLYNFESEPYKKAISHGAMPAKWWPPIIWALLWISSLIIVSLFIEPQYGE